MLTHTHTLVYAPKNCQCPKFLNYLARITVSSGDIMQLIDSFTYVVTSLLLELF